jgi:signal peptidase I
MPFWLFALVIASTSLISAAAMALSLYLAGRLFRARALTPRRCVNAALLASALLIPILIAGIEFAPRTPAAQALPGLAALIVYFVIVRLSARVRLLRTIGIFITSYFLMVAAAFGQAAVLKSTLLEPMLITTGSMSPTLQVGDRFVVDRTLAPRRWDIITFRMPGDRAIIAKRLVGLPGETVEIRAGQVHINGEPLTPPPGVPAITYVSMPAAPGSQTPARGCEGNPITLGPGEFFVLGDNSPLSLDSRLFSSPARSGMRPGPIPAAEIRGVVRCIYAPAGRLKIFR